MNRPLLAPALAGFALTASVPAGAAGFELLQQSASSQGTAYAGTAAGQDASAAFFNPGALNALPGSQLSFGVVGERSSVHFSNRNSTGLVGSDGGDAGGWITTGNAYLALRLGPKLSAGVGVNSPFGLNMNYEGNWIGRTEALKTRISSVAVTPAIAYELQPGLSLGFSVTYQRLTGEFSSIEAAGPLAFKGDDTGWGAAYGVLWQVSKAMRVGVSYRSAIKHELSGNADRTAPAVGGSARMTVRTPDVFTISVAQQLDDRWMMVGDLSKTGWKRVQEFYLTQANGALIRNEPLLLHNSLRVALGGIYRWNDSMKLKLGVGIDRTPTTDGNRIARLPDEQRVMLSVGAQYRLFKDAVLDVAYSHTFVRDAGVENSPNTAGGSLNGSYESSADSFGLQYTHSF